MPKHSHSPLSLQDFSENTQILQGKEMFYDEDLDGEDDLGFRYDHLNKKSSQITFQKKSLFCYTVVVVVVSLVAGLLVGHFTIKENKLPDLPSTYSIYDADIRKAIFNEIKAQNIKQNLKVLTSKPHLAGSEQNEVDLVNFIKDKWKSYLDDVEEFPYDVQLSFPNKTNMNFAAILHKNGSFSSKSNPNEQPLTAFEKEFDLVSAFNAYSPPGHVENNLFYVNYGRENDFLHILNSGVNITNGICISRYGKTFRGDKAKFAEKYGCSALILYSDPFDYGGASEHGLQPNNTAYPHTWWLPSTGFQRGSVAGDGDPLTPGYPALNFTYRIPENETVHPKIPVFPISYGDAYQYLSILNGSIVPSDWQGGLDIDYKYGGSFVEPYSDCKVVVHVGNYNKRKTVKTIIGFIRGWLEPDRYVLLGNHRDAWTFGGTDPSSGTAVVLEVSRAISKVMKKLKWRPRRTIVFCNWAAEEYGLIGSTEWVEQMEKRLLLQAVSYINIDMAVQGNDTFRALACSSLQNLLFNSTKSVENPNWNEKEIGRPTVFDTWRHVNPDTTNLTVPFVPSLGSGSDYTYFIQKTGVVSADIRYTFKNHSLSSYPVYHSIHDTFEYFSTFLDQNFNLSLAISNVAADLVLQLSSNLVLPINPTDTAKKLKQMSGNLQNTYHDIFDGKQLSLTVLNKTIDEFSAAAHELVFYASKLNSSSNDLLVRRINDKLFYINRGFLDFNGLPGRKYYRNVVFAPSSHNHYSGAGFPAVSDAALEAQRGGSLDNVKKQLSVLCIEILSATQLMKDF